MPSFDDRYNRFEQHPRRTAVGWGLSAILIISVLAAAGGLVFGGLNLLAQPGRVIQKTFDAENMIYNYEWFRQQYQDVLAMDGKISVQEAAQESATTEAERTRIASIVAGLRTKRAQMVADYNARASMANRSTFRAGLPETVN